MDGVQFFWGGFEPIIRTIIVGTLAYASLVMIIKISGKRTLATMNALDFIITVAIGAAYGRVLTAKGVSLSEALTAFVLLACLQFIFSKLELKFPLFRKYTSSPPTMLYYNNDFIEKNLRSERINKDELMGTVRKKGLSDLEAVEMIILESDGSFSVIEKSGHPGSSTFKELVKDEKR